ncbi:MAG: hypothetical protein NVS9B14_10280 [Candidatus Acidiferrum sp.]
MSEIDPTSKETVSAERVNLFAPADVIAILQERGWLLGEPNEQQTGWCSRAAALLGPQVTDRAGLAGLLDLIFRYDAKAILQTTEAHVVMSRYAARDVLRQLAVLLLDGPPLSTDRFREVIEQLKTGLDVRGRELFHPFRLALAGRCGEGELDRVILLLDDAASANFVQRVRTGRERILEFCSVFD